MAGETVITVIGNLTNDPELRFTPSGAAVVSFTVASTPRTLDRATNEWKDGDALFLRCSAWRQMAENVTESLAKGSRVIVQGRLKQRSYETREGEKRTVVELDVDEVGPSLRYATAKVNKTSRGGGFTGGNGFSQGAPAGVGAGQSASGTASSAGGSTDDPWSTDPRRLQRRTPFLSSSSYRPGGLRYGEGTAAQAEAEGLRLLQRQGVLHRLQGHRPAAQVHLRPREDPGPAGVR